jgi:hypothetical protein
MVAHRGPPNTNTTPSDPAVSKKTRAAAPATAGRIWGRTTAAPRRHAPAPRVRAVSSWADGKASNRAPTMATTMISS